MADEEVFDQELAGGNEALMDPERAKERVRIAQERDGDFINQLGGVDFSAARARLMSGRQDDDNDPNRACLKGNPLDRAGVMSRHDFLIEKARKEALEAKAMAEERLRDPKTRTEELVRRAQEKADQDKLTAIREAEERASRMEEKNKKRKLAEEAKSAGQKTKKSARLSFDEDAEDSDDDA
ncbi:unnamed protein product [Polarella glacialis]|uniref:Uncharacterized protein n=1 Tax=Polarella glacialis TaxID=89957 RepID=A0A813L625_POLGL|nr:unnamed protein product [Polarella glacialis]CAE8723290.1 unnamed protein product [Polarella glacialis]|mmetsp:Transcript_68936/g.111089  ORF Transcript_68936/g.111089 Transcript_68936/m.111089 type:complete len:182 (-) Transcript_68936:23-568(-)